MAGWALGLGLAPCGITLILAVVFACIVLSRSRDGRDHGKGLAIGALCAVGFWVLVLGGLVAYGLATDAERDESGQVSDGGRVTIIDLRVGDCVPDEMDAGEHLTMDVVPCSEPHHGEVFATFDLDGEYTNQPEIDRLSDAGCLDRFEDYIGVPPRQSELRVQVFRPTSERSFDHDPGVVCLVFARGPVTESLEGSRA